MNYGQVLEQIRDLGFADDSEMEEFETIVPNAVNRAITEISMTVAPNLAYYDIEQDGDFDGFIEYEMPEDFMKFADTPVKRQLNEGVYSRFNDYEVENGNTIVMSGTYEGTYRVFYVADHEPFTTRSSNGEDIPLPLKAHYLLPLLSAYYVWLDDDQAKAQEYYSKYQMAMQSVMAEDQKPKGRIRSDWSGTWL